MSDTDGIPAAAGQQETSRVPDQVPVPAPEAAGGGAAAPRNRAATVSGFFALGAIGALGNFATGIALINPPVFIALATLCALIAIPAGHVGRFRGKRLGGAGRGVALASILTGWLVLSVCLLALLALVGLVAGFAALTDS
ncbi:DUF4190 domain-containing protein [Streptomyces sp. NPDC060198]|uniref:DUF4190 domain-containing protein n=1 Tax=Streptomyces sp. NPDC060198 TaxID=3347070 RepID=UPI00364933FD